MRERKKKRVFFCLVLLIYSFIYLAFDFSWLFFCSFSSFSRSLWSRLNPWIRAGAFKCCILFSHSLHLIYSFFFSSNNFISFYYNFILFFPFKRFNELGCALTIAHDFVHLNKMRHIQRQFNSWWCFTIQNNCELVIIEWLDDESRR